MAPTSQRNKRPDIPFKSDGCTLWPDGNYRQCCVYHDYEYWQGGTWKDRLNADLELMQCVAKTQKRWGPLLGVVMFVGVRIGGNPWVPLPWRWGHGHKK